MVSVFGFRHPKSHFFAPQITENGHFWVKKNGTSDAQIEKIVEFIMFRFQQEICQNIFAMNHHTLHTLHRVLEDEIDNLNTKCFFFIDEKVCLTDDMFT